ncbi:MAG: DoxX family protein [Gemmataceae bacterium]|nr:DoxX family protein [Gemmataceae bacterium]
MAQNFAEKMQGTMTLIGRISLCAIFVTSAVGLSIPNFEEVVGNMASRGIPQARAALVLTICILVAGSLMVILGLKARVGAAGLLVYLLAATWLFHDFWNFQDPKRKLEALHFLQNLSLVGAMLLIVANGSGSFSLDARKG